MNCQQDNTEQRANYPPTREHNTMNPSSVWNDPIKPRLQHRSDSNKNKNEMEDHTTRTEPDDSSEGSCNPHFQYSPRKSSKQFAGHDSLPFLPTQQQQQQQQQPLQPVNEEELTSSDLTTTHLDEEYHFDAASSNHSTSLSHSSSLHSVTKHSGHSTASSSSTHSSLKVFRHKHNNNKGAGDSTSSSSSSWRNTSGHDSLSFLHDTAMADETENTTQEDELKVLCSRHAKRIKLLGEGAFGQVWLVQHEQKSYALKVCAKYDLLTEGAVHEVVREREIMSQLHHPFIARIWATNQDADFLFILEDYLAGGELYSVLERNDGKLSALPTQFYAACIAHALAYVHSHHIVYRDLKPENILISQHGYPTLIDFGCAKRLTGQEGYLTRTLCGTPRFASPEMIDPVRFQGGHGIGTDHWALGILLYEMLTAENPFWYDDMPQADLYQQIPTVEPSWKPLENVKAPAAAIDLIQQLLIKDPTQRLGSKDEEREILQHEWLAQPQVNLAQQQQQHNCEGQVPWIPNLADLTDTQYFDDWEDQVEDRFAKTYPMLTPKQEAHFADF